MAQDVNINSIFGYKSLNNLLENSVLVTTLQAIEKRLESLAKTGNTSTTPEKNSNDGNVSNVSLLTLKKVLDIDKNVKSILSKIGGAGSGNLSNLGNSKDFGILGTGLQKIVRALILSNKVDQGSAKTFYKVLEGLVKVISELGKSSGDVGKGSNVLGNLGKGIIQLGLSLIVASPIYLIIHALNLTGSQDKGRSTGGIIGKVIHGLARAFRFTPQEERGIKTGAENFKALAKGILFMGLALTAAVPLFIIGFAGAALFTLAMVIMVPVFMILDKYKKGIKDGGQGISWISLGIVTMGLSLVFWQMLDIKPTQVLSLVLTLASMSLVFGLIGAAKKYVIDGAWAIAGIGISIIFLSLSIKVWESLGLNVFEFDSEGAWSGSSKKTAGVLGTLMATIVGLGLALVVIGKFKSNIIQGAGALIVGGLALIVISLGVKMFVQNAPTWEQVGLMGAVVGGLGVLMLAAGAGASLIVQGAAVMILSGLSLIVISLGVSMFLKSVPTWEQVGLMGAVVGGLGTLMAAAGAAAVLIIPGAAAMILAGGALLIIAAGLKVFSGLNLKVSEGKDLSGVNKQIELVIGSIVEAFVINPIKIASMLIAAPALMLAGGSMIIIGKALAKFRDAGFEDSERVKVLMNNVSMLIGGIVETFSNISNPIDAFLGVQATKDIGQSLSGIAIGLIKFVELDKNFPGLDFSSGSALMTNIKSIITGVATAFAEINAGPVFSDAESGINATKNIGQSLMGIADGMLKFTDPKFTTVFAPDEQGKSKMLTLVVNMISSIMGAFAEIGGKNEGGSNLFGFTITEGNVDKGITLTQRSAEALTGIADGVMKFKDYTPEQIGVATGNINLIVKSLFNEFAGPEATERLATVDKYVEMMERLADICDPLTKVAKAMSTIAKETGNFVSSFKTIDPGFFDIYAKWTGALVEVGDLDANSFAENASNFLSSSVSAVSDLISGSKTSETAPEIEAPIQTNTVTTSAAPSNNADVLSAINALIVAINNLTNSQEVSNKDIASKLSKLPSNIAAQLTSQTLTVKNSNS